MTPETQLYVRCRSTYNRYKKEIARIDQMQTDIDIIKDVVTEHGRRLDAVYS